ncbi:large subunit GTPase 1 homolog isoform X1 [Orussus abietinus]|uniref:large subunit GTPase 1 homolog isoform X1 n=1 Tax=Orussus abietinus TaxID=222816 RepID=UPI000626C134|nr:large subunit GTPase 1 homolog isoform X1 [Orussus abietinus]
MGKKNKSNGSLGRALIKDRFGSVKSRRNTGDCAIHTTEINDGYDWGRLNLRSVTEENSFEEFLSTAQLAGTEFHAEKLNIKFVNPNTYIGLTPEEKANILQLHENNQSLLKIPRRPQWNKSMSAQELQAKESTEFLQWKRQLALAQETEGLVLTPYEKNLEFWRQLWRVIERSDVIVQIVDARNPLLFRCKDLEQYVKEVDPRKTNMVLLNKADLLTNEQRQAWAEYFTEMNVKVAFFSAMLAAEKPDEKSDIFENDNDNDTTDSCETSEETPYYSECDSNSEYESADDTVIDTNVDLMEKGKISDAEECLSPQWKENCISSKEHELDKFGGTKISDEMYDESTGSDPGSNSSKLLSRDELLDIFRKMHKNKSDNEATTTIGLVGYPNVGKSSTINALIMDKKVSVSATPGKTKHFQTLYVTKDLLLCDCPGLVMPTFVCTKAEMVLNGILPIDQLQDHVPAISLLCSQIPRHVLEDRYGIMIPEPMEGEDSNRPPTSEELLNAYGLSRGFMTQNGQPDNPRSARYVLKDYVTGRLLYCTAPPNREQSEFHKFPPKRKISLQNKEQTDNASRSTGRRKTVTNTIDEIFFRKCSTGVHAKGILGKAGGLPEGLAVNHTELAAVSTQSALEGKPWKKINRHANKKKREKTRRLYAHLDQH